MSGEADAFDMEYRRSSLAKINLSFRTLGEGISSLRKYVFAGLAVVVIFCAVIFGLTVASYEYTKEFTPSTSSVMTDVHTGQPVATLGVKQVSDSVESIHDADSIWIHSKTGTKELKIHGVEYPIADENGEAFPVTVWTLDGKYVVYADGEILRADDEEQDDVSEDENSEDEGRKLLGGSSWKCMVFPNMCANGGGGFRRRLNGGSTKFPDVGAACRAFANETGGKSSAPNKQTKKTQLREMARPGAKWGPSLKENLITKRKDDADSEEQFMYYMACNPDTQLKVADLPDFDFSASRDFDDLRDTYRGRKLTGRMLTGAGGGSLPWWACMVTSACSGSAGAFRHLSETEEEGPGAMRDLSGAGGSQAYACLIFPYLCGSSGVGGFRKLNQKITSIGKMPESMCCFMCNVGPTNYASLPVMVPDFDLSVGGRMLQGGGRKFIGGSEKTEETFLVQDGACFWDDDAGEPTFTYQTGKCNGKPDFISANEVDKLKGFVDDFWFARDMPFVGHLDSIEETLAYYNPCFFSCGGQLAGSCENSGTTSASTERASPPSRGGRRSPRGPPPTRKPSFGRSRGMGRY